LNGATETVEVYGGLEKARDRKTIASQAGVRLQAEFQTLMGKLGVQNLKLVWVPDSGKSVAGEVRNGVVYVYEEDEVKAMETLKHELVDYLVTSKIVKPLVELVNLLIKSRESDIYREKEKIVDVLSKIIV
jgi:hypothetical protein